jgi:hypothetical protein
MVGQTEVALGGDAQVPDLVVDWSGKGSEEILPFLLVVRLADMLARRGNVKDKQACTRQVARYGGGDILLLKAVM